SHGLLRAAIPSQYGLAAVEPLLRPAGIGSEEDIWIEVSSDRIPITAPPRIVKGAHDLHVLLRHRLPPFLGEAFGGSTRLVDVGFGVVGETGDQVLDPYRHPPLALLHVAANAHGPALL